MKLRHANGSAQLQAENEHLRDRLTVAEETLLAIRNGDVDAVVVNGQNGQKVYSLEEGENLYRRLAETVREPMLALNLDGVIVFFNDRLQELLQRPAGEITGQNLTDLIHPEDRQRFRTFLQQTQGAGSAQIRAGLTAPQGAAIPVYWRANSLARDQGEMICLVGTELTQLEASEAAIDALEDQRQQLLTAQGELEASRQRYSDLYDFAPVGYLTLGRAGWIQEINVAGAQILGRPRTKLKNSPLLCHIAPEDRRKLLTHFSLCRRRTDRVSTDLLLAQQPEGHPVFIELISATSPVGFGTEEGFRSVITDITARKRAEQELRESELRFRNLADSAPVLIWISDPQQHYGYFNQPWLRFRGRTFEQEAGTGWIEGIHPDDRKRWRKTFAAAFRARREFRLEYRLRRSDGSYRWVLDSGVPRFGSGRSFLGFIGSCIDITERREMENALEIASRFPEENPAPVMRLDQGRILSFVNPAAREVAEAWKTGLGRRAPEVVSRIARRVLGLNKRKVQDLAVANRLFQVVFAPIRKGGYVNLYFTDITERKHSEEALRESEARFRTLASRAPVGIFMSKPNGDALYVNERWCDIAGIKPAQALGSGWLRAVHRADRPRIAAGWKRAVHQRDSSSAEFRFQRPDGTVVWVQGQASALKDPLGQTVGYIGTAADITDRKLAEEALRQAHAELEQRVRQRTWQLTRANLALKRENAARQKVELALRQSEERLRLMIEGTRDYAIFMLNPDGTVATWNAGAEQINGYQAKEILGRSFSCFYPLEDRRRGKPLRVLEAARRNGRVEEEGWRCRKRGQRFWANVIITALRDEKGALRGFLKVTRDVTEKREIQESLRASERNLADFFEQSPLGLLWITPRGGIRRANQAGVDLFGYSRRELWRHSVQEFHPEPDLAADLLRRLANGQAVQNYRTRIRRKNGVIRHVLIDANGLWEEGRFIYSRWFLRDITRQVELEREILSVAEQERQRLGQDLHDDLCQQLTGIEFLSQTLAGQLAGSSGRQVARAREIARMIRQAITHTRELAHGLSPTELEAEGLTGALLQLADRTHSMFHIDCRFRCKFSVAFKDAGLAVHLYRIAQEAVTNAVKHGKARRVTIQLTRNERGLALAIRDNGHGLPTTLEKSRGMGLRVMQYRAGVINGTLALHRNATGGATVKCLVSNSFIDYK